jgi:long-chain acyl-CoA synthetase
MDRANAAPESLAIGHRESAVDYGQLGRKIVAAAANLKDMGVQRSDRVVLSASSSPSFVYSYFATHLIGAVAVPVDPAVPTTRLTYVADQVEPQVILVDREFSDGRHRVESIEECDSDTGRAVDVPGPALDEPADILFTTGTTGKPKGVVLTHGNLVAAATNINTFIGNSAEDREVIPLPLSHSFGLGRMRCDMMAGGAIILTDGFLLPGRIFKAVENWAATGISFVPAGLALLFRLSGDRLGDYANQLKYIEIGSAPMPRDHKERLMGLLPDTRICMHYGLTEASRATFLEFNESRSVDKLDSVGAASPNVRIRIVDENGHALPPGETGVIAVQGDMVMSGYWNDEQETAKSFADGWLLTSDIGFVDDDGFVNLTGRESELINVAGLKVSPVEVEEALKDHKAIEDCACLGIPDPKGLSGQAVKAFLVPDSEFTPLPTDRELVGMLRKRLETYKIPTVYEWIDSIPKTSSGKVQRQFLRSD